MHNSASWISVSLYHDQLDKVIRHVVVPVKRIIYEKNLSPRLIFNRSSEGGENVIIICEATTVIDCTNIKLLIEEKANAFFKEFPGQEKKIELPVNDWFLPFPNNHVHFKDHFLFDIMETGGLHASRVSEGLLHKSSDLILDLMESAGEEWSIDSSLGIAIQFHLVLLLAFDKNLETLKHFYDTFFDHILQATDGGEGSKNFKEELIEGLKTNFEEQKESLAGFTNYIISTILENSEFEDEWLNNWFKIATEISAQLSLVHANGEFIASEQFAHNESIPVPEQTQKLWCILEYYLRAINAQLGISNAYEINLVYSLQECVKHLSATSEV